MLAQQDPTSWTGPVVIMVLVGAMVILAGITIILIAERAAEGRLGPNRVAGIRTRATRSSDEAWVAAHRAGHKHTTWGGSALTLTAPVAGLVAFLFGGRDPGQTVAIWGVAILVGSMVSVALIVYGAWQGQQAAKAIPDS